MEHDRELAEAIEENDDSEDKRPAMDAFETWPVGTLIGLIMSWLKPSSPLSLWHKDDHDFSAS